MKPRVQREQVKPEMPWNRLVEPNDPIGSLPVSVTNGSGSHWHTYCSRYTRAKHSIRDGKEQASILIECGQPDRLARGRRLCVGPISFAGRSIFITSGVI